jgi:hypothetical protein
MGVSVYRMRLLFSLIMNIIIRKIQQEDNIAVAQIIRRSLEEYGIAMPGTVYTDPTTDHLFEFFQKKEVNTGLLCIMMSLPVVVVFIQQTGYLKVV